MRRIEFRRSSTSRTAVLYSGLFILSSLLTLVILLFSATRDLKAQIRESIQQDVRELSDIYNNEGQAALVNDIKRLSSSVKSIQSLYLLEDANGTVIVGNVPGITPFSDNKELKLPLGNNQSSHFFIYGTHLGNLWLFVGRRAHSVWEIQKLILRSVAWALCITIPIALFGVMTLARQASQRVDAIAIAMDEYLQGNLSKRVPQTPRGDEIDRLADNINNVLRQIEKLIDGMKQVTSDVAHDLRTPLSRLRQRFEPTRDEDGKSYNASTDAAAVEEIDGILATFDALLQIAEIDAGAKSTILDEVNLSQLSEFLFETYASVADDNNQKLELDLTANVIVRGSRRLLTQLLVNLIENAIRHSPKGTKIRLAVSDEQEGPSVDISDTGPGIPVEDRERVFERFYRRDSSRSTPGNGLGLALVRSIAELHGATVTLADNAPGLIVTVDFPKLAAIR